MVETTKFQQIFHRLCHVAALSRDGKTRAAVESLIINVFAIDNQFAPVSAREVAEAVNSVFDLSFSESRAQTAVDRLLNDRRLIRDRATKILTLAPNVRAQAEVQVKEAGELERKVHDEWFSSIDAEGRLSDKAKDELWRSLRSYMAKAFQRHGVETIQLLNPTRVDVQADRDSLSSYLQQAIDEYCQEASKDAAKEYIPRFFVDAPPDRAKFVAQLLDGTFTYFALTVDQATSAYLREGITPLLLFLDSNFIFGALNLHLSPFNDVAREIIETIQKHGLPYTFYFHEETLMELRRVIGSVADRVKGRHWSQALSRAALQSGIISGLEFKYHELNAEYITDPAVYFSKYEHIEELMGDLGITRYPYRTDMGTESDNERHQLVAEYKYFVDTRRPAKPKEYAALNHDMVLWQTVRGLRKRGSSILDRGAFFLTMDYLLYRFDWERRRDANDVGLIILANQFIQLLRPFVPTSTESDQHFMEMFSAAEFRTAVTDYTTTSSKVLSYISAYSDISEQTAVRILTDEVLMHQLHEVDEDSEEFQKIIDNKLARDNEELLRRAESAQEAARSAEEQASRNETLLRQREEELNRERERVASAEARERQSQLLAVAAQQRENEVKQSTLVTKEIVESEVQKKDTTIGELQGRLNRLISRVRVLSGILFCVLSVSAILLIPKYIAWDWFNNHPNKLGLYGCAIIIACSITWAIIDTNKNRRTIALVPLLISIVAVLLQILGK
ncbi:MAG: hypothetical protein QOJ02_1868 [Acidobacteriota bacterium]|jgi:hypothetical protein|nr:hypothetical protein [Acidobacteriota bacterium]